jgi:hypothetical protein
VSIGQLSHEQVGMLVEVVKVVVLAATYMMAKMVSKVLGKVFEDAFS